MEERRFPLIGALGVGLPISLSVTILTLRLSVELELSQGIACILSLLAVAALIPLLWPPARWRHTRLPSAQETGVTVVLALTLVMLWVSAADRSLTWPHAFGVDQAHNGALVTAIRDSGSLSTGDPRLGPMSGYPPGAHLLSAAASRVLHLDPLSAMWLVAMVTVAMQFLSVVWLTAKVTRHTWTAGLAAGALWLVGWRMGLGMVTVAFWFAQSVSVTLSLGGVCAACLAVQQGVRFRWLAAAAVSAAASQLTYPQSTPIVPLATLGAFSIAFPSLRRIYKILTARRRNIAFAAACVVAIGLQTAFIGRLPYFSIAAFSGNGEGIVTPITVAAFGGPIAVTWIAWGVAEVCALAWRRNAAARAVLGAGLGPLGFALLLLALRWSGTPVTQYRLLKNWFSLFPYLTVAGGVAVAVACDVTRRWASGTDLGANPGQRSYRGAVAFVATLSVMFFASGLRMRSTDLPLISRNMYILGRSVSTRYPVEEIGLAGDALGPYTAWWTSIRRLPPGTLTDQLIPRASRYDQWPLGAAADRYLLVDESVAKDYAARPGVRVIARRGGALFLEKVTAP